MLFLESFPAVLASLDEIRRLIERPSSEPFASEALAETNQRSERLTNILETGDPAPRIVSRGDIPCFIRYWTLPDRVSYKEAQEALKEREVTAHTADFDENDSLVQRVIWGHFCLSRACQNLVLLDDEKNICIAQWLLHFGTRFPVIGYVVNAVAANLLAVCEADLRWHLIRYNCANAALRHLACLVEESLSFAEMTLCLLCIMFLFSERLATRLPSWRLHLKGALAILRKCDGLHESYEIPIGAAISNSDAKYAYQMYAYAKNWFGAAEAIACILAPNGGAVDTPEELRRMLTYSNRDPEAGFYIGGFNLVKGHSESLTPVLAQIAEIVMRVRITSGMNIGGAAGIIRERNSAFIDASVFGELTCAATASHLLAQLEVAEFEQFNLTSLNRPGLAECIEACHACFCAALRIFILTVLLDVPIHGPHVQRLVARIDSQLPKLQLIYISELCVHWPLFVAAICALPGPLRQSLMGALASVSSQGIHVTTNSMERIKGAWKCLDEALEFDESDWDCIAL